MRILHVITRMILGGAQQNTILTCAAQVRAGHQVWLAYGPIYGPEGSLYDQARQSGAVLVEVRSLRRAILPLHDVCCYRALRRLIRRVRPEVVHSHSSKAGILARAAAWHEHVPAVIHTIHGFPFHERQSKLIQHFYLMLERWAARRCHRLVGVTQATCDGFLARSIGRPEQFTVVPSGLDLSLFDSTNLARAQARQQLGLEAQAPVIGIVARLDRYKGQDDLLDILPQLLARFPTLKLLMVGDGWHRPVLERRVRNQGLQEHVVFTGLVPPEWVPQVLAAMEVCALPSYQEGQPRALVQALLCGCGIVGYDAGGIGEVCIEGQTGRLVAVGDRQALAQAILDLLEHPQERQRLIEQGRRHARQRFDHHRMVALLDQVYQEALRRG